MANNRQNWWGWLLVGLGVLFLLQNIGLMFANWIWGAVFIAAGVVFLWAYQQDNNRWWALIPGFTLLGLGTLVLFERMLGERGGSVFLGAIGLGFLAVYFVRRSYWWPIIPGGTLLTLAVVAGQGSRGDETGGFLFFLGLAITFAAVYLVGQRWAIWPALGLLVPMVLTFTAIRGFAAYAIPILMVGIGVYLLSRRGGAPRQGGSV
jgi:hypothetical protein